MKKTFTFNRTDRGRGYYRLEGTRKADMCDGSVADVMTRLLGVRYGDGDGLYPYIPGGGDLVPKKLYVTLSTRPVKGHGVMTISPGVSERVLIERPSDTDLNDYGEDTGMDEYFMSSSALLSRILIGMLMGKDKPISPAIYRAAQSPFIRTLSARAKRVRDIMDGDDHLYMYFEADADEAIFKNKP